MKAQIKIRSVFSSGLNLGGSIHTPKRGKGAYRRRDKHVVEYKTNYIAAD